jgi:hypothetical protein
VAVERECQSAGQVGARAETLVASVRGGIEDGSAFCNGSLIVE